MKQIIILFGLLFFSVSLIAQIQFTNHIIMEREVSNTRSIVSVDLDGDNDKDLLIASNTDDKISWYENDGTGSFIMQHIISITSLGAMSVVAIDLDGDFDKDVVAASQDDNTIAWYENLGGGNFGSAQIISTQVDYPKTVFSIDLDGDEDADVLSASWNDNKIAWYENLGSGSFGPQQVISTNNQLAYRVIAEDVDGDGDVDVISASVLDAKIAWYENLGNGVFGSQQVITITAYGVDAISCNDIDGDGDNDIISTSYQDDEVAWYENLGFGGFSTEHIISNNFLNPSALYVIDMDNDTDLDIVFSATQSRVVAWAENDGFGNFVSTTVVDTFFWTHALTCSDLDGDNDIDIAGGYNGILEWYKNDSTGSFGERDTITFGIGGPIDVIGADLDGDGDSDVLSCSNSGEDEVTWFENLGSGEIVYKATITNDVLQPDDVLAVDLDGDLDLDVISGSRSDMKIAWYENDGFGNFGTQQIITDSANTYGKTLSADLDGDGDNDILFGSGLGTNVQELGKLIWWSNDGTGSFLQHTLIYQDTTGIRDIHIEDMDNDGDLDILVAYRWFKLFVNDGSGNFSLSWVYAYPTSFVFGTSAGDMDGDGLKDIILVIYSGHLIWLKNNGGGSFSNIPNLIVTGLNLPQELEVSDLDLDGDMDLIAESANYSSSFFWFLNDGTGNFGQAISIADSTMVTSIGALDIDQDGDFDILYNSYSEDQILWAENIGFQETDAVSSCANEPFILGSQVLTTPGTYIDSLQSIYGLDSIVEVDFTHIPIPQVELDPFPSDTVCIEEEFLQVPFASPTGGEFTDTNIINNQLDLYATGEGLYELIYTYTDTATGCSNSDTSSVKIVVCTLIEEVGEKLGLNVYPNPTDGILNVEINASKLINTRIIIFDTAGRVLESREIPGATTSIDLSKYNPGTYYLKIETDNGSEVRKVVLR